MIFAALDYWCFRRQSGRYSDGKDANMRLAHHGPLPQSVIDELQIGDMILTQRLDSRFSWAMQYFSSSMVDHAAIYKGEGRIAHITLSGFREHSVKVFGKGFKVLPIRLAPFMGDPFDFDEKGYDDSYRGPADRDIDRQPLFPAKAQLVFVGIRIVAGVYPDRFRWKFLADLVLCGIILDLMTYWLTGVAAFTGTSLIFASVASIIYGTMRLRQHFGARLRRMNHPDLLMRVVGRNGGLLFTTMGPLVLWQRSILPLHVFRALGRQRPEDSPDDEFEAIRQNIRDTIESWDLAGSVGVSKNEERDEHQEEKVDKRSNGRGNGSEDA